MHLDVVLSMGPILLHPRPYPFLLNVLEEKSDCWFFQINQKLPTAFKFITYKSVMPAFGIVIFNSVSELSYISVVAW
jgi:hypothetical protein